MNVKTLFILLLFLAACKSPEAVVDYDTAADFENYSSYGFYPDLQTGLPELTEERLIDAVTDLVPEEGLQWSEHPGLYLNITSEDDMQPSRNRLGIGIGNGGRNFGIGIGGSIPVGGPKYYLELTFDLVDVTTDELVWQAVVRSRWNPTASPEEKTQRLRKIVRTAFEQYPPKE